MRWPFPQMGPPWSVQAGQDTNGKVGTRYTFSIGQVVVSSTASTVYRMLISHLTYSKDGRSLAATLGGTQGVRIFRTRDYQLEAQDTDYGDDSYWSDFDGNGRLVTVSLDGFVRLYDNRFHRIAKAKAPGGTQPYSASFSPDGSKIAIGFKDSTHVNVLSGEDLRLLYSPDTQEATNGSLFIVAWSADGRFLYAGGQYDNGRGRPILKWDRSGRGDAVELAAADNTVIHILPLKNGGLAFGTSDPAFGVFDRVDRKVIDIRADKADFRDNYDRFLVSHNGTTVQFGFEQWGKRPAQFSFGQRALTLMHGGSSRDITAVQQRLAARGFDPGPADGAMGPRTERAIRRFQRQNRLPTSGKISDRLKQALGLPQLAAPITQRSGLDISNWRHKYSPTLNGETLALEDYERSRSLAIAPDSRHFLLGTEWFLRLFDRKGTQQWRVVAPSAAWGVNITGDGRLAVAAFGDGTIRWFRLTDGKELLAFFPHKDGKRWVVWTPEGFFDASEGGEALIGYHLNQGRDQAAGFVGVEQLYGLFYRPDLVAKRLEGGHEDAIRTALARIGDVRKVLASGLPPTVELVGKNEMKHTSRQYTLHHTVIDRGGGIGRIVYRVNGVEVTNATGRPVGPKTPGRILKTPRRRRMRKPLTLKQGQNTIRITAYNAKNEIESPPITLTVDVNDPLLHHPSLYALTVGITNYRTHAFQLKYAAADATAMAQELQQRGQGLFKSMHIRRVLDKEATRDRIERELRELASMMQPSDVFILYLAGHGLSLDGKYHFIPWELVYENEDSVRTTALGHEQLLDLLSGVPALKSLIILDTCNSGAFATAAGRSLSDITAIDKLMQATGRVTLSASSDVQMALEGHEGHGVFTYVLLDGLRGKADRTEHRGDNDGEISTDELARYTRRHVPRITLKRWGYEQFPMRNIQGDPFSIGLAR